MYADVLTEINSKNLDKTFTYEIGSLDLKVGERVIVPFGKRKLMGFVLKIHNDIDNTIKYKKIIEKVDDDPVINEEMMSLGKYISKKTLSPLITCYQTMLPKALKAGKITVHKKYNVYLTITGKMQKLSKKQEEYYNLIKNSKTLKKDVPSYIVKALIEKGVIKESREEIYRLNTSLEDVKREYKLTLDQENVIKSISLDEFKPYLLHGVTGSGKTLVYITLTKKVIKEGKQVIILVPEISLTPQMVKIFSSNFKDDVAILHSGLSDGEKYDEWRKIETNKCHIVIGARSAIFAPFKNLGLIIIDEEHSETYKQENIPKYNTIDVAIYRAKKYKIPLVLGSATPSIESYTRAKLGIYKLLEMKTRVNKNMPNVHLIDMKEEFKKGNRVFSEFLKEMIRDRLKKDEQIIILLNRRGYNTSISCNECGYTQKCPNCDIPLTYHKRSNSMICHYCGHTESRIVVCPNCKSKSLSSFGMGTEKLCDLIKDEFNVDVLRMDQDTTSRKGAHERILKAFADHKYNILVGTQMIAKGLDFEDVTLVAVINCDASLNIPDFRSSERTFQLLSQVSGRSGRSKKKGDVILQGFNLTHYSIECVKEHNYQKFYNEEIKIRKVLKYPPFYNLCSIRIMSKDLSSVMYESNKIAQFLRKKEKENIILGPSPAMIPKVNNIYYYGIVIKYKKTGKIMDDLIFINDKYKSSAKVNVQIDLNPQKL